jgi:hypothetical protein
MKPVLAAALAAVFLAGCGAATGPTPTPPASASSTPAQSSQAAAGPAFTGDPCALLTDDEIKQITKQPIVSKTAGQQLGVFDVGCDWEVGPPNQVPWSVQVGIIPSGGRSYYDKYFAPFQGTPVSGIGDVALEFDKNDVLAVHGDVLAGVEIIAPGNHDLTLADQLMKLVIGRV